MNENNENEKTKNLLFLATIVLILAVILLAVSLSMPRVPKNFTQIYLDESLTPGVAQKNSPTDFGFWIYNNEEKDILYKYLVAAGKQTADTNFSQNIMLTNSKLIDEKEILIKAGEKKLIKEKLVFPEATEERQKVLVLVQSPLLEKPFTLWFFVKVE